MTNVWTGSGPSRLDDSIDRRGLRDHVHDRVLQILLSGEVEPGARLSIDSIARQLNVSPTPVREAMVQLERTGLITREALKGYRVAPPLTREQLADLFDARMMLELTAARLATPADEAMMAELRAASARHRAAGEKVVKALGEDRRNLALTTSYFAADAAFHDVIFRHCGNRYLQDMSESLGAQLHRMRQSIVRGITDVLDATAEHDAIVAAFAGESAQTPEEAMRHHIEQVRARSLKEQQSD